MHMGTIPFRHVLLILMKAGKYAGSSNICNRTSIGKFNANQLLHWGLRIFLSKVFVDCGMVRIS
jgi:hypothetical protein